MQIIVFLCEIIFVYMRIANFFIWLLIGLFLHGCKEKNGKVNCEIADLNADFPTTELLDFKSFKSYRIGRPAVVMVDGGVLWYFAQNKKEGWGPCFDLNSGKQLGMIVGNGKGENQMDEFCGFRLAGDSVMLYADYGTIKTFNKQDIINNVPITERKCTIMSAPDSLLVSRMIKLSDGSYLATIRPPLFESEKSRMYDINQASVVRFKGDVVRSYETIRYDDFHLGAAQKDEIDEKELIKWSYAQGFVEALNDDLAVFSVSDQFMLYTLDLKTGKVLHEKRYTEMQRDGIQNSLITTNAMNLKVRYMTANDKYILCLVCGYLNEKDKEAEEPHQILFVFDWQLKPVCKYDLPMREDSFYCVAKDGKTVYFCRQGEMKLSLRKAELKI